MMGKYGPWASGATINSLFGRFFVDAIADADDHASTNS